MLGAMKRCVFAIVCLSLMPMTHAQPTNSFPLWTNAAPGALGSEAKDVPTLTPFYPGADKATGAAIVVLPGGGYSGLASHEGEGYARWLNEFGVTAFVLKYRLGSGGYHHPVMLQDGARAIRYVRANAEEWGLDPKRIGIIGSSAGGHLASTVLTHFESGKPEDADPIERVSSRPDIGILCYAVITMGKFTHRGSKENLLGKNPAPELVEELSNELRVTTNTPPCFLWSTYEDKTVPVENTLMFAEALRKAGVPFDLHVFQKGGHGMGLGSRENDPGKWHPWTRDCIYWLKVQGFVK
jgi:acetyl esterase/lipase